MTEAEQVDKAIDESLALVRAFRVCIDLPKKGAAIPGDQQPESFADIERLIHQNHLDKFWESCMDLETPERQAQGSKGFFASYIYKSTLPFPPELYEEHLGDLEAKLEEIRTLSYAYLAAGKEGSSSEISNAFADFSRITYEIRLELGLIAKYAVDNLSEIPDFERAKDEKDHKSAEVSVLEKNRRINRRKDVLQTLTTAICDNVADIKKIVGVEAAKRWAPHGAEPAAGSGPKSGPESGIVPGEGDCLRR